MNIFLLSTNIRFFVYSSFASQCAIFAEHFALQQKLWGLTFWHVIYGILVNLKFFYHAGTPCVVFCRILELKNEMVLLEYSEYHYLDDVLSDLKLTPVSLRI